MTVPNARYPAAYLRGLTLFNRGEYWSCHEALEEIWLPEEGEPRDFYQAIIQTAAAFHHATHTSHWHGVHILFEKAREKMARYRPRYLGLDTAALHDRLAALRDLSGAIEGRAEPPEAFRPALALRLWPDDAPGEPRAPGAL